MIIDVKGANLRVYVNGEQSEVEIEYCWWISAGPPISNTALRRQRKPNPVERGAVVWQTIAHFVQPPANDAAISYEADVDGKGGGEWR